MLSDTYVRLSGSTGNFEVLYQSHPHTLGSWHQKTIIIDDSIVFLGGMNAKENDWDTDEHNGIEVRRAAFHMSASDRRSVARARDHTLTNPPRHDYMTLCMGPIVMDVAANFVERWNYSLSQRDVYYRHATRLPNPPRVANFSTVKAQITRTIPAYPPVPRGEKGIKDTYVKAIGLAKQYIYIEDQYFRSVGVAREIANAMNRNPQLHVIIVSPPDYLSTFEPGESYQIGTTSSYWTAAAFQEIRRSNPNFRMHFLQTTYIDARGNRVFLPIDLHAKIMIVDDVWYTIGSCNFNDRGFEFDGEMNVSVQHSSAGDLRKRVMGLHLGRPCPDAIGDAVALWNQHAEQNARAWAAGTAPVSKIFPYRQAGPLLPVPFSRIYFAKAIEEGNGDSAIA